VVSNATFDLKVGSKANHLGVVRSLDGQIVSGTVYVWLGPIALARDEVDQVRFSLDGRLLSTENASSFDLFRTTSGGDGLPFDTTLVADGTHTVSAVVRLENGQTFTRTATFSVANGAQQKRLVYSTRSNRSSPAVLDGATISSSSMFISLSPAVGIEDATVRFYLNDTLVWTELYPPYDLGGTKRDGTANGFTIPRGTHTIKLVIALPEGVTLLSQTATFTR
jgi:large repetitive protein